MNLIISIASEFGTHLSDGSKAYAFRLGGLDPYVDISPEILLDFTGVRSANSSFINALIGGAVEQHGPAFLEKVTFKGCTPVIQVLIESAVSLGMDKHRALHKD
jgi:hypothetical protein